MHEEGIREIELALSVQEDSTLRCNLADMLLISMPHPKVPYGPS